jgi:two-component system chemotaxis response regulator CheY
MTVDILIVDDSLPMRSIIQKSIIASGFGNTNFIHASNGSEALQMLREKYPHLVITDYNMPDMNGIELVEEMKHDERLKAIPVLVVSTEGSRLKIEEFIRKGASGYIKKPFTPEMIKQKLIEILGEADKNEYPDNGAEDLDF